MSHEDGTVGALLGLAVGDALGAQVEFAHPQVVREVVARGLEMVDSGYWAAGQWTDDTALALELAESIAERGLLDADDVARRYISWATTDGRGIGRATRAALMGASDAAEARRRASAFQARTGMGASNGTVMRCAPIGLAARDRAMGCRSSSGRSSWRWATIATRWPRWRRGPPRAPAGPRYRLACAR